MYENKHNSIDDEIEEGVLLTTPIYNGDDQSHHRLSLEDDGDEYDNEMNPMFLGEEKKNNKTISTTAAIINSGEIEPILDDNSLLLMKKEDNSIIMSEGEEEDQSIGDSGTNTPKILSIEDDEESLIFKDDKPPPIPRSQWIRILVIFSAVLSDGLSLTLVQPFLPAILVEKWGYVDEEVGTITGILVGCYSLARFFSGFYLGHLSDRYGRKPFLVLSLFSTGIGTLIFAFMPNVKLALMVRFIEGLLSNSTALCQATLSDLVHKRNRPAIFAYLGGVFALSRCLSSSLGGFLVNWFEDEPNPYIYPCIVGGGIVLISCTLILILHPETHPKYTKLDFIHERSQQQQQDSIEMKPVQNNDSNNNTAEADKLEVSSPKKDLTFIEGMKEIGKNKGLMILLAVGGLNSYNNGGLLLGIVLFATTKIEDRGLGFGPAGSGVIFTILGFSGFIFQVVFFKRLSNVIGLKRQYILGMSLLCVGIALFPLTFTGYLIQGEALVWVFICLIVPVISIGFMQGLPIVQGMVANSCNPIIQGLTQGVSQSLGSFLRAFGPAISGAIFSFSAHHTIPWLLFIVLSVVYVIIAIISNWIPESVDINRQSQKLKADKDKLNSKN